MLLRPSAQATLLVSLLAVGCDTSADPCSAESVAFTFQEDASEWWLWAEDGPSAAQRALPVSREGDTACHFDVVAQTETGEPMQGIAATYDANESSVRIVADPQAVPPGLHRFHVSLRGDGELARHTLTLRHLPEPPPDASHHVVVFGVDGLRPDGIAPAHTPTLDTFFRHGVATLAASTQQTGATSSGPGWASILTGIEVARHGVTSNDPEVMTAIDRTVPTFYDRAYAQGLDTRLFAHWIPLSFLVEEESLGGFNFGDDALVTRHAESALEEALDLLFLHLDDCDHAGHASGFGPENPNYQDAVEAVDAHIERVVDAILRRETFATERWLFVMVTDHGGEGTSHGAQDAINQTIPLVFAAPWITPSTLPTGGASHMDVAPTVLSFLGLDTRDAYDGRVVVEALP